MLFRPHPMAADSWLMRYPVLFRRQGKHPISCRWDGRPLDVDTLTMGGAVWTSWSCPNCDDPGGKTIP